MAENPNLETIRKYYDGCNRADIEQMMSTFDPNIVHYFVEEPPVHGARQLAEKWAEYSAEGRIPRWTVDHGIAEGNEAVIEWTFVYTRPKRDPPTIVVRGAEWYLFKNGRIVEIRAYDPTDLSRAELVDFPYAARGYPTLQKDR